MNETIFIEPKGELGLTGSKAITIALDGRIQADLNWSKSIEAARSSMEQGFRLFWKLDLGLFSHLSMSLSNKAQYLSLGLSLEHFRETIWTEFGDHSIGVCYYRGNADFSDQLRCDAEQEDNFRAWLKEVFPDEKVDYKKSRSLRPIYCRDICADYLALLSTQLSDSIPSYLMLDISQIESPLLQAQLISKERYDHFHLAIKGCQWPFHGMIWKEDRLETASLDAQVSLGICLPSIKLRHPSSYEGLEGAMNKLLEQKIPFRVIPESSLATEWDGLDDLIYVPAGLTVQGKRQLQGFAAAGGTAISTTTKGPNRPNGLNGQDSLIH